MPCGNRFNDYHSDYIREMNARQAAEKNFRDAQKVINEFLTLVKVKIIYHDSNHRDAMSYLLSDMKDIANR